MTADGSATNGGTNGRTNGGTPNAEKAAQAAQEKYTIGHAILEPAVHHESFQKLWEKKWKAPVSYSLLFEPSTMDADISILVYDGRLPVHVRHCKGL